MNIPMAYDSLPTDPRMDGSSGALNPAYGSHMTSVVVGSNLRDSNTNQDMTGQLAAPLLLNDQEAAWAHEMSNEGIGHLPVKWYRQTPHSAVWGPYGLINRIISALVNFGINAGLGYAILHNNDEVGLWAQPDYGDHPYASAAWSDLYLTTVFICFFTCLLSTGGIRSAMKKGQTVPVDQELLKGGYWRCVPVSVLGTCSRSFVLSLWGMLFICSPFIAILEIVCVSGGMHGMHSQCSMEKVSYIYLKAAYATVVAFTIYPIVLLMTLNTATLPPLDLTFFAQNQKEKWEKEQRDKAMQPEAL